MLLNNERAHMRAMSTEQLRAPLETRAAMSILDYVLRHTKEFEIQVDTRLDPYVEQLFGNTKVSHATDERLLFLIQLLAATGMKIDPEALNRKIKPKISEETETTTSNTEVDLIKTLQPQHFFIRKEPFRFKVGGKSFELELLPNGAFPNLNTLSRPYLDRYLTFLGMKRPSAERLAAIIKDWTDKDSDTTLYGAELSDYHSRGLDYGPHNEPITSWSEFSYLLDVTPDLVHLLRRHFSLWGLSSVHPDFFPHAAIAAMTELPLEQVEKMIAFQKANDENMVSPLSTEESERFYAVVSWEVIGNPLYFRLNVPETSLQIVGAYKEAKRQLLELDVRNLPLPVNAKPAAPTTSKGAGR